MPRAGSVPPPFTDGDAPSAQAPARAPFTGHSQVAADTIHVYPEPDLNFPEHVAIIDEVFREFEEARHKAKKLLPNAEELLDKLEAHKTAGTLPSDLNAHKHSLQLSACLSHTQAASIRAAELQMVTSYQQQALDLRINTAKLTVSVLLTDVHSTPALMYARVLQRMPQLADAKALVVRRLEHLTVTQPLPPHPPAAHPKPPTPTPAQDVAAVNISHLVNEIKSLKNLIAAGRRPTPSGTSLNSSERAKSPSRHGRRQGTPAKSRAPRSRSPGATDRASATPRSRGAAPSASNANNGSSGSWRNSGNNSSSSSSRLSDRSKNSPHQQRSSA